VEVDEDEEGDTVLQIDDEEAQLDKSFRLFCIGYIIDGEEIFIVDIDYFLSRHLLIDLIVFIFDAFVGS